MTLLRLTDRGLYCEAGDFFVDPWGAVDRAVVTHAHGDHVAWGCRAYLTSAEGLGVLRSRLAPGARVSGLRWGEGATVRGVRVSFHPAGHILGSAQIRLELGGEVWVVSGDYKTDPDPTTTAFEPVRCHTFVTESTFGLPIYRWPPQQDVLREINEWWRDNQAAGKASLLYGYALGKAQRLIAGLDPGIGPILTHGAVERMTTVYRAAGVTLPPTMHAGAVDRRTDWARAIILAPPSADGSVWTRRFGPQSTAFASGWMLVRGTRRRRSLDRGFPLSDHVDWPALMAAIGATGAPTVWVTHGFTMPVVRWLRERGLDAHAVQTRFEGEQERRCGGARRRRSGGVRDFARLYTTLDETTATGEKVAALAEYFRRAPPAEAAWAVHFLIGRRPKRVVSAPKLAAWASEAAGIPPWLFEESHAAVGDLAETITLLLPDTGESDDRGLSYWVEERLLPLRGQDEAVQREEMLRAWRELDGRERFVWNKLITGAFRVGVLGGLVERALSLATGVPGGAIAHRLTGGWEPTAEFFARLCAPDVRDTDVSRPYPFFLAYPLESPAETLGPAAEWMAEWKWDGIRSQLIRRSGRTFLWSRGDELLNGRFPEVEEPAALLPEGTVIDGELLPWVDDRPLPFAQLQRRIGRKTLSRKVLDEVPVALVAYDLLEQDGEDLRPLPLEERRTRLATLLATTFSAGRLVLSPAVQADDWGALAAARERARELGAEGLMLKRLSSAYGVGRRKGDWWKWKVEPYAVDAVLMYAQAGSGRRAGLFTDYTFGVWDGDRLVAFAKAYSGLTDSEIRKVDSFVRRNTLEKHGPVRVVRPELVFELAFEGIQASPRHKSGVAVRFPRIARWRTDKRPEEADTLATVGSLLDKAVRR